MINYKRIAEFLLEKAKQASAKYEHDQFMRIQSKLDRVLMAWKKQYQTM